MKRYALALFILLVCAAQLFAQSNETLIKEWSDKLAGAKTDQDISAVISQAKDAFFALNDFDGFVDFLSKSGKKKKDASGFVQYYTGLARYKHMKYLEETQNWDIYFANGNDYRQAITENLEKAVKSFPASDPIHLYSRLIIWQFHKDQQDAFCDDAMDALMTAVSEYARTALDVNPLKDVADTLLAYDQRPRAREVYRLYGDKIISSDLSESELQNTAMAFYKQGNLELSQALYGVYVDKISKTATPEKLRLELVDIARMFSYKKDAPYDLYFAEKMFSMLESNAGADFFDEALFYRRIYNIEKSGDFKRAGELYGIFTEKYPQSAHYDEALFKIGLINLYVLRDIPSAQGYFSKLAGSDAVSSQVLSSIYQLGLIAQWQEDGAKAKEYYELLGIKAGTSSAEIAALAKARLSEIDESRPLEYNIKTFMDVSLKPENSQFGMSKAEIKPSAYSVSSGEPVIISAEAYPPESGCMQVQVQYYWAGDAGQGSSNSQESSLTISYTDAGTKVIGLVATTPSGVIDRAIAFIDVN